MARRAMSVLPWSVTMVSSPFLYARSNLDDYDNLTALPGSYGVPATAYSWTMLPL